MPPGMLEFAVLLLALALVFPRALALRIFWLLLAAFPTLGFKAVPACLSSFFPLKGKMGVIVRLEGVKLWPDFLS